MDKPKLNQTYWYIDLNDDLTWTVTHTVNRRTDMDIYRIACHNCFSNQTDAEDNAYTILLAIGGLSPEETSRIYCTRRLPD